MREAAQTRALLPSETIKTETALGRITASAVHGQDAIPPFDNSSMDGYALASARASGAVSSPVTIPVLGTILAGDAPKCQAEAGAWRIMTGAPMPAGCDSVVPVENARDVDGGRAVEISSAVHEGDFVRSRGDDFAAGAEAVPAGVMLEPKHLMALAAVGAREVEVRRRPRLALIATGRELAPADKALAPGQIRDASSAFIAAECARLGWDFETHGVVADDENQFRARLELAADRGADIILTTGAVSMGDADFIPRILTDMGAEHVFHKVAIKPGRPVLFTEFRKGPWIFGLPGNPVSTVVGMRFFVRPFVRHIMGQSEEIPFRLRLAKKTAKPENLRCFFKARRTGNGQVEVLPGQASFLIHSMLASDCWAVLPEAGTEVMADQSIDIYEA
ncbi:MAG: molybdopterin molybdotransferase MoeA [Elusimicrobiota bacterium]|nr:MAG: molybdopterin molybdotransferase MoeA [Elusimicrobiota bacterium]